MPDLLPKTFHLAESSSLFSQINDDSNGDGTSNNIGRATFVTQPNSTKQMLDAPNDEADREQAVSMVEIRATNLTIPKKAINAYNDGSSTAPLISSNINEHNDDGIRIHTEASMHRPKVGDIVNTINLYESADYFEPECVETVHIIDATSETSDTDTAGSTPNIDAADDSDGDEYETGELPPMTDHMTVERARISYQERKRALSKDRDMLRDSEQLATSTAAAASSPSLSSPPPLRKKFTPTLKEILSLTERDSFYDFAENNYHYSNNDNAMRYDDEPLVFSDDDDQTMSLMDHRLPITVHCASILLTQLSPNQNPLFHIPWTNHFYCSIAPHNVHNMCADGRDEGPRRESRTVWNDEEKFILYLCVRACCIGIACVPQWLMMMMMTNVWHMIAPFIPNYYHYC